MQANLLHRAMDLLKNHQYLMPATNYGQLNLANGGSNEQLSIDLNNWLSNHFRCDHPMHILHQRSMLCRKMMKFIEQGSIDKLRHIFVEEQNVPITFCKKRPTLFYKIFAVSCFNEK